MENHTQHSVIGGLKDAFRYLRAYRNSTFVLKLGGEVLDDAEAVEAFGAQVALLSSLGIRVVVVHGGGPQVSAMSRRLGIEPRMIAGRRITDPGALDVVKMVCAGSLNVDLVGSLRAHDLKAVGLTGMDAGLVQVTRRPPVEVTDDLGQRQTVDFGCVGDVQHVDPAILKTLLDGGFVPVLACLGGDA